MKLISISINEDDLLIINQYVISNSINRSKFIVNAVLNEIKKSKGKKIK